jgi:hypothetical protein
MFLKRLEFRGLGSLAGLTFYFRFSKTPLHTVQQWPIFTPGRGKRVWRGISPN